MWNYRAPGGRLDADGIKLWSQENFRDLERTLKQVGRRNPYQPIWTASGTAPALGNGALTGSYVEIGAWMHVAFRLTMGSTTTFGTGNYKISLPRARINVAPQWQGVAYAYDVSATTNYIAAGYIADATPDQVEFYAHGTTAPIGQLVPFTWANGDALWCTIGYPLE